MLRSATTLPGARWTAAAITCSSSARPLLEQFVLDAECAHLLHEGGVLGADRGQLEGGLGLFVGGAELGLEQFGHLVRADLFQLVDAAQHPGGVGEADAVVEALGQLAVVDPEQEAGIGRALRASAMTSASSTS